jgi:hypothetical protein
MQKGSEGQNGGKGKIPCRFNRWFTSVLETWGSELFGSPLPLTF